jgi:K+-sensing histidine kinase KdpD
MAASSRTPTSAPAPAGEKPPRHPGSGPGEYLLIFSAIVGLGFFGLLLPGAYYTSVGLLFLLAIVLLSLRVGRGPILAAGFLSALVWEYFFVPPRFSIRIDTIQDGLLCVTYFVVALVVGQYTTRLRMHTIEREHLQAARERATLLAESEKLHRVLLDSVSHELRTPLAVITAALEGLDQAPASAGGDLVGEMRTAVHRLNRVIGNLLDQTRLEGGSLKPRIDWCDARDVVNAAVADVHDALQSHPLEIWVPDEMPPVRADFVLTEQALANLLLNAAIHTPPEAPIFVAAGLERDGQQAYFTVADRGAGIPPAAREGVFKKFARAESARAGGLGLGLSIVRGFIAAQNGDVLVGENPGGGAVFTIYLPHTAPHAAASE